jgi:DNA adenine methylase
VGAGSVFLATDYESYVINDANPDLMAMWAALQGRPREYTQEAASYFVEANRSEEAYLGLRTRFNAATDAFERATLLPYLNRFGFNGLYRVTLKGVFNVSYGKPKSVPRFPWDEIEAASVKLQRCLLLNGGFRATIEMAGEGDVVYCDPPYVDDETPSFTQYTAARFGMAQQRELVDACWSAASRGVSVLVSNHDTATTRALYDGWEIHTVSVRRSVSADAESRVMTRELVARLG